MLQMYQLYFDSQQTLRMRLKVRGIIPFGKNKDNQKQQEQETVSREYQVNNNQLTWLATKHIQTTNISSLTATIKLRLIIFVLLKLYKLQESSIVFPMVIGKVVKDKSQLNSACIIQTPSETTGP